MGSNILFCADYCRRYFQRLFELYCSFTLQSLYNRRSTTVEAVKAKRDDVVSSVDGCPPRPIWIVSCIDAPAVQPTQRSTMPERIISVGDYTTLSMIHGSAGTSYRNCFTLLQLTTADPMRRIVSSAILSLTFFPPNF